MWSSSSSWKLPVQVTLILSRSQVTWPTIHHIDNSQELKLRLTLIFIFDIVSVNSVLMSSFSSQPTVQVKLSPGI